MNRIGLITTILCIPIFCQCSTLGLEWKFRRNTEYLTINSTTNLDEIKAFKVGRIYFRARKLFFDGFEKNLECDQNRLGIVDIYIVEEEILRDPKYFTGAKSTNFGRFYGENNIIWYFFGHPFKTPFTHEAQIFIIPDMFQHPEYLAHELGHFFYAQCGVRFKSDEEEHVLVYGFQEYFREMVRDL